MEPVCETLSSASAHVQGLGSPAMLLIARYRPDDSGVVRKKTLCRCPVSESAMKPCGTSLYGVRVPCPNIRVGPVPSSVMSPGCTRTTLGTGC